MARAFTRLLDGIDRCWSAVAARAGGQGSHLLVALFHGVTRERGEADHLLAPAQTVTLDDIRRFLDAVLSAGYLPVSLDDLRNAPPPEGKQLLVTFDDGYFSNAAALPVLESFQVPGAFFISTNHVRHAKAFWWDVAARLWRRHGASDAQVRSRLERAKQRPAGEFEQDLLRELGATAFRPLTDLDRPFHESELKDFARSAWVTLGNHTADHTILTRCGARDAELAMTEGRRELECMTGVKPYAIAYPDGAFSAEVAAAASRTGHDIGFTCLPRSNALPLGDAAKMVLGRHIVASGLDYASELRRLACTGVLPGTRLRMAARGARQAARSRGHQESLLPLTGPARGA